MIEEGKERRRSDLNDAELEVRANSMSGEVERSPLRY